MTGNPHEQHQPPKAVANLRRALERGGMDEHTEAAMLDAVKARLLPTQPVVLDAVKASVSPAQPGILTVTQEEANQSPGVQLGSGTTKSLNIDCPQSHQRPRRRALVLAVSLTIFLVGTVLTALFFQSSVHWPIIVTSAAATAGAVHQLVGLVLNLLQHRDLANRVQSFIRNIGNRL